MQSRSGWAVVGICGLLAGCGTNSASDSERVGSSVAKLELAPQVSPDIPLDRDVAPDPNPNATLLSVGASVSSDYLLAYSVPYAPDSWSRFLTYNLQGSRFPSSRIELLRWNQASGAALPMKSPELAPGSQVRSVKTIGIDGGWLVVYEVVANATASRRAVWVSADGSLSVPTEVPGSCAKGLAGLARAGTSALLTDLCGGGVWINFFGPPKQLTIATRDAFTSCSAFDELDGGQVAFNGIDFFVLYFCRSVFSKSVVGFPVSPAGDVLQPVVVATPAVPFKGVKSLSLAGNLGGGLLAVVAQDQSSGPNFAAGYRTISETSAHVFTVGSEHFLPGESIFPSAPPSPNPGTDTATSDHVVTAITLGADFAMVREHANGDLDLVRPNSAGSGADTIQALQTGVTGSYWVVGSGDPYAGGGRFLLGGGARAVRFDTLGRALDVPAAVFFSSQRGQFAPSVAFDGETFLAAWTEAMRLVPSYSTTQNSPQIFGHRLSANGALFDGNSFAINPTAEVGFKPLVAANPGSFSSTWSQLGSSLAGAATVSATEPPVMTRYPRPASDAQDFGIAVDGARTAVAWSGNGPIMIARLESGGTWSEPLMVASAIDTTVTAPALAFNQGQYAVLWTGAGNAGERVLYGARVSADMTLLDAAPKELTRFTSATSTFSLPADTGVEAIAVGDHFVVAWADVAGGTETVRLARLSNSLEMLDPTVVTAGAQPYPIIGPTNHRVALDWDGSNIWVVWRDNEGGARRPSASLRGRRFFGSLEPVDSNSFLISSDLDEFSKVTLAHGAGDSNLVGYTRYSASEGSFRVRARFLSSTSFADGTPCANATQCQSGACVGGYCTTSAGSGGTGGVSSTGGVSGSSTGGVSGQGTGGVSGPSMGGVSDGAGGVSGPSTGGVSGPSTGGVSDGSGGVSGPSTGGVSGPSMGGVSDGTGGVSGPSTGGVPESGSGGFWGSGANPSGGNLGIGGDIVGGLAGGIGVGGSASAGIAGSVGVGGSTSGEAGGQGLGGTYSRGFAGGNGAVGAVGVAGAVGTGGNGHAGDRSIVESSGGESSGGEASGHASGGRASTDAQPPEPDSCSCRVPGSGSAPDRGSPLAALLLAIGGTLYRRRLRAFPALRSK